MDDWELEPARDLDLSGVERYQSDRREFGLVASGARLVWWSLLRTMFRVWNRLTVIGREHLPAQPSFVLVANHASHLDALVLASVLPLRLRDQTYPMAARDVFFTGYSFAAFSAVVINAVPVFRGTVGSRGLATTRERLLRESCVVLLFPEGTRSRVGEMSGFKAGVGMLVAGTHIPVIPCHIEGAFEAMPPNRWFLRPKRLTIRLGPALTFDQHAHEREGWDQCAAAIEAAVRSLMPTGAHCDGRVQSSDSK